MKSNIDVIDIINRIRDFKDKKQLILNHANYLKYDLTHNPSANLIFYDLLALAQDWKRCNSTDLASNASNFVLDVSFSYDVFSAIMLFKKSLIDTTAKRIKIIKNLSDDIHDFRNCHDDTDEHELKTIMH